MHFELDPLIFDYKIRLQKIWFLSFQLLREEPSRVLIKEKKDDWLKFWKRMGHVELEVQTDRQRGLLAQLSADEKKKLYEAIGYGDGEIILGKPKQYIGRLSCTNYQKS